MSESPAAPRRLLVGLGNPGPRYRATRHNCGFLVVERLAQRWGVGEWQELCRARCVFTERADLAMPETFMNRSGYAVRCLAHERAVSAENILVIYDDVALPLGTLRLRGQGSPGGHRGLESILESMTTSAIPRLRLGIAPRDEPEGASRDLVEYVLEPFAPDQLGVVEAMVARAADACESWLADGLEVSMNRFNGALPAD